MVQFFHPSKCIREKWLNDNKCRLTGVIVTGEGMRQVQRKVQMCYLMRISNFNDGTIFPIVKENFKINLAPTQPFASKAQHVQAQAAVPGDTVNPDCSSKCNVTANIEGGLLRAAMREEIKHVHQQGITIGNDNQLAPENVQAPGPGAAPPPGTREKPQFCFRCANANFSNQAGKFIHHQLDKIANMDELQLFCMCFPEKWIVNLVIPQTNKTLDKPMDLQGFYVWLGCIFFMSCFFGIKDCDLWCSTEAIDMFDGAPFCLNKYMTKASFHKIMESIRYTSKEAPLLFMGRFHKIQEMIESFNDHDSSKYKPS